MNSRWIKSMHIFHNVMQVPGVLMTQCYKINHLSWQTRVKENAAWNWVWFPVLLLYTVAMLPLWADDGILAWAIERLNTVSAHHGILKWPCTFLKTVSANQNKGMARCMISFSTPWRTGMILYWNTVTWGTLCMTSHISDYSVITLLLYDIYWHGSLHV